MRRTLATKGGGAGNPDFFCGEGQEGIVLPCLAHASTDTIFFDRFPTHDRKEKKQHGGGGGKGKWSDLDDGSMDD